MFTKKSHFLLLAILYLLIVSVKSFSQQKISGSVVDDNSGAPISLAEVFISGTTIGTVTNENGRFELKVPYLPCQIIFNHLSYTPVVYTPVDTKEVSIKLTQVNMQIKEVTIQEQNNRRKNLRLFYEYFIGTENQDQYDVLNDSVLHFSRNDTSYHAYSYSPLVVRNNYLGYEIEILISDFYLCKKETAFGNHLKLTGLKGIMVSKLTGYYYYKPMEYDSKEENRQIEINRLYHYYGSIRHLLKSVYDEQLKTNGFLLWANNKDTFENAMEPISDYGGSRGYKINADTLLVKFHTDTKKGLPMNLHKPDPEWFFYDSEIYSSGETFIVRENGTSPDATFQLKGSMGERKIVNTLPEDYKPNKALLKPSF